MKRSDLIFILVVVLCAVPFFVSDIPSSCYDWMNINHPYTLAFLKFAVLSTVGEMMGLRIKSGEYTFPAFGIAPRAILWGVYGVWIAIAMKTFANGAPTMVEALGVEGVKAAMATSGFSWLKLLGSFSISVMMNMLFAPVFMTMHKITDAHIVANGGALNCLLKPINMGQALSSLDWQTQWSFVIKKTIPLFWVPAHTITFMLPMTSQVLFAALLSIFLGVFLSIAVVISRNRGKN